MVRTEQKKKKKLKSIHLLPLVPFWGHKAARAYPSHLKEIEKEIEKALQNMIYVSHLLILLHFYSPFFTYSLFGF